MLLKTRLPLDGTHPFYLEVDGNGYNDAHGVFLRNSNGMDVELTETSLTYKVIGGEPSDNPIQVQMGYAWY